MIGHIPVNPRRVITYLSALLCVMIIAVSSTGFFARAEEIDETNPELTLANIDSSIYEQVYEPDSDLVQGDGKYKLTTNAFVAWNNEDDIAFAYRKYNVSSADSDYLEAGVTINSEAISPSGATLHHNSSIGLMMRSGLANNASQVFLHVRANTILVVFRNQDGKSTAVQYNDLTVKFPLQIKMIKTGNQVALSFKTPELNWTKFKFPVGFKAPGPLYVGIAAHSCEQTVAIQGDFSDFYAKGIGTYDGTSDNSSSSSAVDTEPVNPDAPATDDILLRETFSDGDFYNKPATALNPVWSNLEYTAIKNLDGNRVWSKNFSDSQDFIGNQEWTDYLLSTDICFTENCNPDPEACSNIVKIMARHQDIPFYGNRDYAVVLRYGYEFALYKRGYVDSNTENLGTPVQIVDLRVHFNDEKYTYLNDGKFHNVKLRVFDNKITAFWDDTELIAFTDNGDSAYYSGFECIFGKGSIGIATFETSVYIDNITVYKLQDDFGGDYDNKIGGNWDEPIPDDIRQWSQMYTY